MDLNVDVVSTFDGGQNLAYAASDPLWCRSSKVATKSRSTSKARVHDDVNVKPQDSVEAAAARVIGVAADPAAVSRISLVDARALSRGIPITPTAVPAIGLTDGAKGS